MGNTGVRLSIIYHQSHQGRLNSKRIVAIDSHLSLLGRGVAVHLDGHFFFATSAANGTKANSIQIILFQGIS